MYIFQYFLNRECTVSDLQALARDRLRGLTDPASWIVGVASFTVRD